MTKTPTTRPTDAATRDDRLQTSALRAGLEPITATRPASAPIARATSRLTPEFTAATRTAADTGRGSQEIQNAIVFGICLSSQRYRRSATNARACVAIPPTMSHEPFGDGRGVGRPGRFAADPADMTA